ncbi:MAG: glycosyltransferase, partial [Pedobacter sp.]
FRVLEKESSPYENPNTLGCIVVSEDSFNYLKFAYSKLNLFRIRLGIGNQFVFSETKKKQIAFMPRKLPEDINQIFQLISKRPALNEWSFVAIDDMAEAEVAKILKESALFLSFNDKEGFGLPPVEAMACGCYVIGYTGEGGKEYFNTEYSSIIEHGNILAYVKEIERIVEEYNVDSAKILQKGLQASIRVKNNYNMDNERLDILKAWATLKWNR